MPKADLTNSNINSMALPKVTQDQVITTSIHQSGLSLVVRWRQKIARPSKSVAEVDRKKYFKFVWRFRYPINGKRTSLDLGYWPSLTQDSAVDECHRILFDVEQGVRPAERKQALAEVSRPRKLVSREKTVSMLAISFLEWRRASYPEKESTTLFYEKKIQKHILPRWGLYSWADITTWVWQEFVRETRSKVSPTVAKQVHSTWRAVHSYAALSDDYPDITSNIFLNLPVVKEFETIVRDRYLSNEELHTWKNEIYERGLIGDCRILDLQLFQGVRIREILNIKISDLGSLSKSEIPITVKGGRQAWTMVSSQAIELIKTQLKYLIENKIKTDYLFPGLKDVKQPYTTVEAGDFVKGIRKDWIPFSTHDLRRTMRTWLQEFGCSKEMRDRMTNHAVPSGKDASYDHSRQKDEKLRWAQRWADELDNVALDSSAFSMETNTTIDEDSASELADLLGQLT